MGSRTGLQWKNSTAGCRSASCARGIHICQPC